MIETLPEISKPGMTLDVPTLVQSLCLEAAYPQDTGPVSLIETHISWVFLTKEHAYKLKKPVNFGFIDYSSLDKRHFYCDEELRLNRRFAPNLYLSVVPISGTEKQPQVGGDGTPIEYAVKMRRFPDNQILTMLAYRYELHTGLIDDMANHVASFHQQAASTGNTLKHGSLSEIQHWFSENTEHIRPLIHDTDHKAQLEHLTKWGNAFLENNSELIEIRRTSGSVRECHGDLHLGNMVLIDGKVTLFDCIEFNPGLRWIDVISEVAFIVMDLEYLGYADFSNRFLNRYLQQTGDYAGLAVLDFYRVYRAMVRAKVAALSGEDQYKQPEPELQAYLDLANRISRKRIPLLIITHGYSGAGKSRLAAKLAEQLNLIHVRSDIERKRLYGLDAMANSRSAIDKGIYTPASSEKTYSRLLELTGLILKSSLPVIIDATFLSLEQRSRFQQLAQALQTRFLILDIQAPEELLRERIEQRLKDRKDASEADSDVLSLQLANSDPFSKAEAPYTLTVDTTDDTSTDSLPQRIIEMADYP